MTRRAKLNKRLHLKVRIFIVVLAFVKAHTVTKMVWAFFVFYTVAVNDCGRFQTTKSLMKAEGERFYK